jgi:glycine/D-amino acid oxidase-like deaminating enzyme/nitrite reductase/ring-hydroxylating ferredoxin subunit
MTTEESTRENLPGRHEPIWLDRTVTTDYDPLDGNRRVETAVVGGGIVGVTTAAKLDERGQTVAIIERDRILTGVTGHTTAKVTSLHGLIYDHLIEHFGVEKASQYAQANQDAIADIADTVSSRNIDCAFTRAPAYTYVRPSDERGDVRNEVEAARRLDLPVSYVDETDLPYEVGGAVRFDDQAHFDPRKYLLELADGVADGDSAVFEQTTVQNVEGGDPCRISTDRGDLMADSVVVASHFPVEDDALYFARMSPKRSYVLAVSVDGETPDGMYYHPREPYVSVRPHSEESVLLVGGQNHRTGHGGSTQKRYEKLEAQTRERFQVEAIEYRWSTQDFVTIDRVPFVGPVTPGVDDVYVATGFGGWGMTNGTAAATAVSDAILGTEPDWAAVFHPTRFEFGAARSELLLHNSAAMGHLFEGYLENRPSLDTSELGPGEAAVFDDRTDPIAVYRDEDSRFHAVSAVCSHMGCVVEWNDGERSWDCPCHGSRFDLDGTVLDTPAVAGLDTVDLPVEQVEGPREGDR